MRNLGKWEQFPFRTFKSWKRRPMALPWIFHDKDTKCTTLQSGFLNIMKMMLNSRYQEKIGILCRIQNHFCWHVWMINKLFTNNTCLVSRLNSIVFLSVRILLSPNQPLNASTARSLAGLDRINTMYVETQSISDRLIPTATIEANKKVKMKLQYI